jgi:hypothetical protein
MIDAEVTAQRATSNRIFKFLAHNNLMKGNVNRAGARSIICADDAHGVPQLPVPKQETKLLQVMNIRKNEPTPANAMMIVILRLSLAIAILFGKRISRDMGGTNGKSTFNG